MTNREEASRDDKSAILCNSFDDETDTFHSETILLDDKMKLNRDYRMSHENIIYFLSL